MKNKILILTLGIILLSSVFVSAVDNKIWFGRNESNPSQMIPFLLTSEGVLRTDMNFSIVDIWNTNIGQLTDVNDTQFNNIAGALTIDESWLDSLYHRLGTNLNMLGFNISNVGTLFATNLGSAATRTANIFGVNANFTENVSASIFQFVTGEVIKIANGLFDFSVGINVSGNITANNYFVNPTLTDHALNGDFATLDFTGWTVNTGGPGSADASTGQAVITAGGPPASIENDFVPTIGQTYKVSWDLISITGTPILQFGGVELEPKTTGIKTQFVTALTTDSFIAGASTGTTTIDDISIISDDGSGLTVNGIDGTTYADHKITSPNSLELDTPALIYTGTFGFDIIPTADLGISFGNSTHNIDELYINNIFINTNQEIASAAASFKWDISGIVFEHNGTQKAKFGELTLRLQDNYGIDFGNSGDAEIIWDGSDLIIKSNDITPLDEVIFQSFSKYTMGAIITTPSNVGFFGVAPKAQQPNTIAIDALLTNYGLRASGGISNFDTNVAVDADNNKLLVGAGQDASVYYNGSDMIINPKEVGNGLLKILGKVNVAGDITSVGTISTTQDITASGDMSTDGEFSTTNGDIDAGGIFKHQGVNGVTGSFLDGSGNTISVDGGIITGLGV
ncbi:hypothetical protein LCGC14_1304890 [marine sediment metagenome]|uniref:Uncharacterized protein n=1 Tax=marine sediment metagenome TaxID=412755 RepID=A0A0F9KNZ5_9ZZZZ